VPYPTIKISDRSIILLGGHEKPVNDEQILRVRDKADLELAAFQHPDAVAFGYFPGPRMSRRWVPAA
jgi:hypothetical protein